jgi:hypothetical protein
VREIRRGAYARRNAGHRLRQHQLAEQAGSEWELLRVSFDGLRAAIRLLQRRRPPLGTPPGVHQARADALAREAAAYLADLAGRIDRGEYDARREEAA